MTKLVVGDLHGQWNLAERALETGFHVIFMGDYVDSFTAGAEMCVGTLRTVLEAVEEGRATALWGNHDLQYFDKRHRCGGYNIATQAMLDAIGAYRVYNAFKFWHYDEGFLFTHGGLTNNKLVATGLDWKTFLEEHEESFHTVGPLRGGRGIPGIIWCDWREFQPVPGLKQIVGHTRGNMIREKDGNYCVDVLEDRDPQGLLVNDGQVQTYTF